MLTVVGLALTAAFLFALAASLQQHEAQKANRAVAGATRRAFLLGLAERLARSRFWRLGWGINLVGFLAQAAALHRGSVALVQPLLVTQLIFSLPLATAWTRRWPDRRAWLSAATICAGLVVFLVASGGSVLRGEADRTRIVLTGICIAVVVAVLIRLAVGWPAAEAAVLAVAAGLCLALSAVLIKLTAEDLLVRGVGATSVDWPGYSLALSTLIAVVLGQWAFASGSLPTVVAATTITNPVASYLIGILAFQGGPELGPARVAGVLVAGGLISAGVVGLAHSPVVSAVRPVRIRETRLR